MEGGGRGGGKRERKREREGEGSRRYTSKGGREGGLAARVWLLGGADCDGGVGLREDGDEHIDEDEEDEDDKAEEKHRTEDGRGLTESVEVELACGGGRGVRRRGGEGGGAKCGVGKELR